MAKAARRVNRRTTIIQGPTVPFNNEQSGQNDKLQSLVNVTTLVYALQALSFLLGVTCIIALIINYVKRDDVAGTWLASHFRWQIRTFWFGLLWAITGWLTFILIIGYFVLVANGIWIIYRIVKGWLYLNDAKPMTSPQP